MRYYWLCLKVFSKFRGQLFTHQAIKLKTFSACVIKCYCFFTSQFWFLHEFARFITAIWKIKNPKNTTIATNSRTSLFLCCCCSCLFYFFFYFASSTQKLNAILLHWFSDSSLLFIFIILNWYIRMYQNLFIRIYNIVVALFFCFVFNLGAVFCSIFYVVYSVWLTLHQINGWISFGGYTNNIYIRINNSFIVSLNKKNGKKKNDFFVT